MGQSRKPFWPRVFRWHKKGKKWTAYTLEGEKIGDFSSDISELDGKAWKKYKHVSSRDLIYVRRWTAQRIRRHLN